MVLQIISTYKSIKILKKNYNQVLLEELRMVTGIGRYMSFKRLFIYINKKILKNSSNIHINIFDNFAVLLQGFFPRHD